VNWLLVTLGVLVSAVLSFWWLEAMQRADTAPTRTSRHEPDYYLDHMVRRTLGDDGVTRSILYSKRVEHFPDDDSIELASPHLELYNSDPQPWHVSAESGWISSGNNVVLLHGAVEIWKLDRAGKRRFQILTTELRVLPKERYAETDSATTIVSPASVTRAIGMRANLAHDKLELVNRVRSRHEPSPQS